MRLICYISNLLLRFQELIADHRFTALWNDPLANRRISLSLISDSVAGLGPLAQFTAKSLSYVLNVLIIAK